MTHSNIYTLRCHYEHPSVNTDYPIFIEVRIRTKL